jgi:RNA polymerase primary sigma factor
MDSPPNRPLGRIFKVSVAAGIESAVRLHILRGDNLEARDEAGRTPLLIAAAKNRAAICKTLLEAGADPLAMDTNGQDALSLAVAHGSLEATSVIKLFLEQMTNLPREKIEQSLNALATYVSPTRNAEDDKTATDITPKSQSDIQVNPEAPCNLEPDLADEPFKSTQGQIQHLLHGNRRSHTENDAIAEKSPPSRDDEFGDWEPIHRREPPPNEWSVVQSESKRQHAFSMHAPIDSGASWEDLNAYLPDHSNPLPRSNDPGLLETIRALLRRVLREGSVPRVALEDVLSKRGTGEERDKPTEAILEFIIGDLGGDFDERLEFYSSAPTENFEVTIAEDESQEEESQIDEALLHFEDLRSSNNDPLRIYLRSAGSHSLLTPDQEVSLASKMETAVEGALDALTTWPEGIAHLVAALKKARYDTIALGRIVVPTTTATQDADVTRVTAVLDLPSTELDYDVVESEPEPNLDSDSGVTPKEGEMQFENSNAVIDRIFVLAACPVTEDNNSELRQQLGLLRFRRSFLISLLDRVQTKDPERSSSYRRAISELLTARSKMAESNLRLVLDLAKRYLRSGADIQDLIQDGNIGLLTAIDRFEWRRGFRFSTMATWWIKQSITRNLADKLSAIRLPVHVRDQLNHGLREIEIIERRRVKPLSIMEQAEVCGLPVKRFEDVVRTLAEPISMEQAEFDGLLDSELEDNPFEVLAIKEQVAVVEDLLNILSPMDRRVLRMRYGISVNYELTLEQVGQRLGLSRERIRQIESRAFKRLASNHRTEATAVALGISVPKQQSLRKELQSDE